MHRNGRALALDATASEAQAAPLIRLDRPPRRVLFFGKSMARTRSTGGLVEALERHGLDVRWLNMAKLRRWRGRNGAERHARRVFERHAPDLVFVFCRDLPKTLLAEFSRRATVVLWVEESLRDIGAEHVDYFALADLVFMTNPSKFAWLREHGVHHTAFVLEGFSTTWHRPLARSRKQKQDIVFIGGPGKDGSRVSFLAEVARRFDLQIRGPGWDRWRREYPHLEVGEPVGPRRYRELCATSRIVLGINQVNDDPLYFSNRTLFTLGCRGFHLTHYVPKLETVFENHEHLVWYRDLDDCFTQIEHYLTRPDERERIARSGCAFVTAEHQFDKRVAYMLEVLRTGILPNADLPRPEAAARDGRRASLPSLAE